MRKRSVTCFFLFLISFSPFNSFGQVSNQDSSLVSGYVGIQVNELLKQIINFDDQDELINNPYLLQAGFFFNKKWGAQLGIGYDYASSSDKYAPGSLESELHDVDYRIGVARHMPIGKKMFLIAGADFVGSYTLNRTQSSTVVETSFSYDSTMNFTREEIVGLGGGLQVRFGWMITNRISLATESTFYYIAYDEKENVMIAETTEFPNNPIQNSYQFSSENAHVKRSEFKITIPVAIFLSVHF